jgi:hypothetical protein
MGILTRASGDEFIISSDRDTSTAQSKHAPRLRAEVVFVWTGTQWSKQVEDALRFDSLEAADEYVRANMAKVLA